MTPGGTFERVYGAIKQRLREGYYRPGERLEPAALSDELNASVTPVRDALHRLTGERLVEAPRHDGFRAPMLTEAWLRQLYAWHRDLLLLALRNLRDRPIAERLSAIDVGSDLLTHERQKAMFLALVQSTANVEHLETFEALSDRLQPVQQLAATLLDAAEAETGEIGSALRAYDRKGLRRALIRYHRRREKLVPELLAELLKGRVD
jgi:DNA-binding GntR family transcriptional regulator